MKKSPSIPIPCANIPCREQASSDSWGSCARSIRIFVSKRHFLNESPPRPRANLRSSWPTIRAPSNQTPASCNPHADLPPIASKRTKAARTEISFASSSSPGKSPSLTTHNLPARQAAINCRSAALGFSFSSNSATVMTITPGPHSAHRCVPPQPLRRPGTPAAIRPYWLTPGKPPAAGHGAIHMPDRSQTHLAAPIFRNPPD